MVSKEERDLLKERINIPGRKTYQEVFDNSTLMVLYDLMSSGQLDILAYPIATGKEAKVFKGVRKDGTEVAVKIMRINTAVFRKYREYIEGDHRFKNIGSGRNLIFNWTKKEFSNLKKMHSKGVRVPEPYAVTKNVLVMEYLKDDDHPAPMLKDLKLDDESSQIIFEDIVEDMKKLHNKVKLIHGDLSEYNILLSQEYPYFIDVSQSVPLNHPKANELINRDIRNMVRYFSEHGVSITKEELLNKIIEEE